MRWWRGWGVKITLTLPIYRRYDLIPRPHMPYLHWFYFWPPEVSKFWRSRPPGSSEVKKSNRIESEQQKAYDLIPHLTYFHWFHIWSPEVTKFYRSRPPGSSEVKKVYQNGIGTPKKLWFDTSKNMKNTSDFFHND